MTETMLMCLFAAIVHLESSGRLNVSNGSAVGPAQIKPPLVEDCRKWGHNVSLKDRESLEGSYRLFRIYTDYWIKKKGLKDSIQNRANIWRHGPNSSPVKNGTATAYSLKAESLVQNANGGGIDANHGKGPHLKGHIP